MNWVLLISIAIHLTALVCSVELLRRLRDWRLAFLSLMLALMILRRGLALFPPGATSMSQQWAEVPALVISVMSLLAVYFLGALLDELKRSRESGKQALEELGERERRLQAIIETEPECVKLLGPGCTLLQMNPAGLRMIEADSLGQVVGRSMLDLVLPEYQRAFAELTECVLCGATETLEYEIQGLRGTRLWLETHATPYRDASGQIVSLLGVTRDITERKRVDAALRSAEALFRNLVEQSLVGIQIVQDGKYAFANSTLAKIFGYTEAEVLALESWTCVVADEDRDMVLDQVRRRVSGETPRAHYVFRGLRKDRTVIDIEIRSDRIELHGRPAVLGMLIDITERKRAEDLLRASEERFATVFRSSPVGVCISTLDAGTFLDANEAFLDIVGHTREAVLGRSSLDLNYWIDPEDRRKLVQALKEHGSVRNRDVSFRRKDGSIGHSLRSLERITIAGEDCILTILNDITEGRRVEQELARQRIELQIILDTVPALIFYKDRESRFVRVNRQLAQMMGLPAEEFVGKSDADLGSEFANRYREDDLRVMTSGQPVRQREEPLHSSPGERWLMTDKVPYRDESGQVVGVIGFAIDVTERKRVEDELRASRERLQVLSRQLLNAQEDERRHIARELHDQVGQSLTAIKLNLKSFRPPDYETSTLMIFEETINVVDQTLEQVRTLSLELRPSMLDDLGLVAALRWYLDRQAQRTGFSVQFVAESMNGDVSQEIETTCFRVVQEIVTNIARHAHAQNVRVELRRLDTELELFIQDDGVGFDLTAARERAMSGNSMGLLGMQERVLIVGGRLEIQSAPSRGTEVRVRFPLMPT